MSYTKKAWTAGQKVKSADLNNMETGIDNSANPFIVTLTPTAQDYSGTMDKTVAEITEAYEAGKRIVFKVLFYNDVMYADGNSVYYKNDEDYPSVGGYVIYLTMNALIYFFVQNTSDGTKQTYVTTIYPLTPMT